MDYSAFHWAEKARKYAETVGTIFNVKGRVNTVADLPATGNKVGDLWLVGLTTDNDLTEFAWLSFDNVTRWEKLGSTATTLAFNLLTGSPYDNTALSQELNRKANSSDLSSHIGNTSNPHSVTKAQVGLGNVDNTSDLNKPVSTATQTALNSKAGTSLDNLSADGQAILDNKLNKQMISNCITDIPQDIKLELNNGALTLKAGSKVYVPNGSGVFDNYTSSVDKTATNTTNGQYLAFTTKTFGYLALRPVSNCSSGSSSTATTVSAWYDTTNNKVKYTSSGTTWLDSDGWTLPIALVTVSGGAISSIDQVFNGFGYIGSTVFALPGLKGLSPNGRNEDGSLKSSIIENTQIITRTFSTSIGGFCMVSPDRESYPISTRTLNNYIEENNLFTSSALNGFAFDIAEIMCDSTGKITSFIPKTVFHVVDYSDFIIQLDNKIQLVSTAPATQTNGVLYVIPE